MARESWLSPYIPARPSPADLTGVEVAQNANAAVESLWATLKRDLNWI